MMINKRWFVIGLTLVLLMITFLAVNWFFSDLYRSDDAAMNLTESEIINETIATVPSEVATSPEISALTDELNTDSKSVKPFDTSAYTCDYDVLKTQAEEIIGAVEIDFGYWTDRVSVEIERADAFGEGEMGTITPCSYRLTYTSTAFNDDEWSSQLFDRDLGKTLLEAGWSNEMGINFVSDSTGVSTSIALFHAGGPNGIDEIYARPLYAERSVQFARVRTSGLRENWQAYMRGESETMCPCREEITLEVSAPVSLVPWLE